MVPAILVQLQSVNQLGLLQLQFLHFLLLLVLAVLQHSGVNPIYRYVALLLYQFVETEHSLAEFTFRPRAEEMVVTEHRLASYKVSNHRHIPASNFKQVLHKEPISLQSKKFGAELGVYRRVEVHLNTLLSLPLEQFVVVSSIADSLLALFNMLTDALLVSKLVQPFPEYLRIVFYLIFRLAYQFAYFSEVVLPEFLASVDKGLEVLAAPTRVSSF